MRWEASKILLDGAHVSTLCHLLSLYCVFLLQTIYKRQPDRLNNQKVYTPYAGAAGMLLHMNGQFTMGKLKSSLLSFLESVETDERNVTKVKVERRG
jgi:hypothetical protein